MARPPKTNKKDSKGRFEAIYKPEFCDMLIEHMSQGNSFASFCAVIKVSRVSGYRWVQVHDDFFEAKRIADEAYQKWWEDVGRSGMVGKIKGFNAAAWIFSMKNRFNWSDKQEIIESNERVKVEKMTDQELMSYVEKIVDTNSQKKSEAKGEHPSSVSTRH